MVKVAYFDTSALLKHYVTEIGSNWVNAFLSPPNAPAVFTSHLTLVEATCAFARRLREGNLSTSDYRKMLLAFDYDITHKYNSIDVMPITINAACQLANEHPLRAYDALQLATAWLANQELVKASKQPLTFVAADTRLLTIAQAEGLLTDNPLIHP